MESARDLRKAICAESISRRGSRGFRLLRSPPHLRTTMADLRRPSWNEGAPAATAQAGTEIQIFQPAEDHVETESTYSSQFKRWPIEYKGASKRGDGHRLPVTPFEGGSTYSDAYKPLVQQQKYVRPKPPSNFPPQPHAAPLQTTHRAQFVAPPIEVTKGFKPDLYASKAPYEMDGRAMGRSTYQDAFVRHPYAKSVASRKSEYGARVETEADPGQYMSSHRDQFKAPPPNQAAKPFLPAESRLGAEDGRFDGSTVYRDSFKVFAVPRGAPLALGIQLHKSGLGTGGGNYYEMIKAGTKAPALKRVSVTTVEPNQTKMEVLVVGRAKGAKDVVLGKFAVDGIPPAPVGDVQVGIELSLQEGMKVRVTASGEQNFSGTKSLVIKELA